MPALASRVGRARLIQTLFGIGGVEGLVGTAGLQDTERGDGHPLAAGDEHRHHVALTQSYGLQVRGDAVAQGVNLGIGVALVLVDHSHVVGGGFHLALEERHDGLGGVVVHVGLVEQVERRHLRGGGDLDVAEALAAEHPLDHGLITLQILGDEGLGVFVRVILGLHLVVAVADEGLQVERGVESAVANALGLHGIATQLIVGEEHAMPCEHAVALRAQVFHQVAERVNGVLAATAHLLLAGFQEFGHGGALGVFHVYGQGLHQHAYRAAHPLVVAAIVDGGEERLLLVVELGQQEGVGGGEQRAPEDAVLLAECIHACGVGSEGVEQAALCDGGLLKVGNQWCEHVTTVEVAGIPLLRLLEEGRLTLGLLVLRHLGLRDLFFLGGDATVGLVDVAEHQLHRCAIDDDVVVVDEKIEVLG